MSMDVQSNNNIKYNSSYYLCEKSTQWIKDNTDLLDKAKYVKRQFKKLISKLESVICWKREKKLLFMMTSVNIIGIMNTDLK